jgi:acetyltransferase-like isoleucine patch superfamily enzyme
MDSQSPPQTTAKRRPAEAAPTGVFDAILRAGKGFTIGAMLIPIYLIASVIIGAAVAPGIGVYHLISGLGAESTLALKYLSMGVGIAAGFFTYGFSILLIVPLINLPLRGRMKAERGSFHSARFLPWYLHNSLAYIVRYSFLDYVTPSPLNHMYFRLMGMKIGKNAHVNTSNITDAAMITIEENVTIGGSATIIAHYGQSGYLILAPTLIRKGATIGILATVMAGADIGENATVLPHSVVLPKTRIPAGETWGGVPARKIEKVR